MRLLLSSCALVLSVAVGASSAQAPPPDLAKLLRAAGAYVADYERTLSVIAEEDYTQQLYVNRRTLHSDILFMQDDEFGWVEFRDTSLVDGRLVRDRQARLLDLFSKPKADRLAQAQRILAEGARFNIDPVGVRLSRTINLPLTALRFLRTKEQYRSDFNLSSVRSNGVVSLEFAEQHRPRLITTPDQGAATGVFDVDAATGRVLSSRLTQRTKDVTAMIEVTFGAAANIDRWVPLTMSEQYRGSFNGIVTGNAKYSKYRQFKVETSSEIVKH
jgi:hypothetical protein